MKHIYFTVGPSQLFPTVPENIKKAIEQDIFSLSHRGDLFHAMFQDTTSLLRQFFNIPSDYHIFFLPSATEAMERVIQNCVEKKSVHLVAGAFSKRFCQIAQDLKKETEVHTADERYAFNFNDIKLSSDRELLCVTHTDTSIGVTISMQEIYRLKKQYPNMFIAVDIVSSAPVAEIDYQYIDCSFFSLQKGFGLPAGLGILIVSPQMFAKSQYLQKKGVSIGSYHSFSELLKYADKSETPETPNVFLLYLLNNVIKDMLAIGLDRMKKDTKEKADMLYEFFDHHEKFTPFVHDKSLRSPTVVVVDMEKDSKTIIKTLKAHGIIIGSGYAEFKDKHIRIANFPAHTVQDVKKLIQYLK